MRFSIKFLLWLTAAAAILLTGVEIADRMYVRHQQLEIESNHILLIQQLQNQVSGLWEESDGLKADVYLLQYQMFEHCQRPALAAK